MQNLLATLPPPEKVYEEIELLDPHLSDAEIESYLERRSVLEGQHNTLRKQMEAKLKQKRSELEQLNFRFEQRLEATLRHRQEREGFKTLHFDYGTVRFRKAGGGIKIVDEKEAVEWCQRNRPTLLIHTVDNRRYKEYAEEYLYKTQGELPPGVGFEPERLSMSISTGAKDSD